MSAELKRQLDNLYEKFNNKKYISNDPVEFPHRYKKEEDILIIGFISAIFSFGRVVLFKSVLQRLFERIGEEPTTTIENLTFSEISRISKGLSYRFYSEEDIRTLILILRRILKKHTFLDFISSCIVKGDIVSSLVNLRIAALKEADQISPGVRFMFPDILSGGTSKRLMMFMRWMVRKDNIDFGIIDRLRPRDLIIPLDTHIAHISIMLKLTSRTRSDLRMAIEVTEGLKKFDPDDPIKYDFPLAHIGISEGCTHKYVENICKDCFLKRFCNNG